MLVSWYKNQEKERLVSLVLHLKRMLYIYFTSYPRISLEAETKIKSVDICY